MGPFHRNFQNVHITKHTQWNVGGERNRKLPTKLNDQARPSKLPHLYYLYMGHNNGILSE